MEVFIKLLTACAPVIVAAITIIPTIISNRKKTEESIAESNRKMEQRIDKIQQTLEGEIREREDDTARYQRYRILRFYDEMCEHRRHSESHFEDILDDCDQYEAYCNAHPDFPNSRGHLAILYIRETYAQIKTNGGFLTHE